MDPIEVLARHRDRIVHRQRLEAREAVVEPWPDWIEPRVVSALTDQGAAVLWAHQSEALQHLHRGRNVVLSTGTASGKTLAFLAPALSALAHAKAGLSWQTRGRPSVLYLSPTKALAADQFRRLPRDADYLRAATVDGDSSREERVWARERANYVLTNPDALHYSILPSHSRWSRFFAGLRYVVIDECHHYRGVFGAHVAQIIRRLRRICAHYGADPQFVLSSATVSEPAESARRLIGLPVEAVTEDGSAHGAQTIVLWEPPLLDRGDALAAVRRSATNEAADVLTDLVVAGVRTVCFVRSRRGAEHVARAAQNQLEDIDPGLAARVATYRGGYLPEERRQLEQQLRTGELLAVASTNALELGIDVSGLDAVVSVGFPGTRAGLQQQFGRAGRSGQSSLGVMIARDEPIDTYLIHHPDALLGPAVEATIFDPDNPYVLGPHLAAAAQELGLTESDLELFGARAADGVAAMESAGMLRRRATGWYWTRRDRAADLADLRSSGGRPVQIVDSDTGRLIGTVNASSADSEVHEGAIYVHQGQTFRVEEYDIEHQVAIATTCDLGYSTSAQSSTAIRIARTERCVAWGSARLNFGEVEVSSQVNGFAIRDKLTGRVISDQALDLPVRTLPTKAVWWTLDDHLLDAVGEPGQLPGAAHAAEHAAIGLLPLLATCDRWDIGGLSTQRHGDTGLLTVFVYDGYPGGAGFAERGFEQAATWLTMTRNAIASCSCVQGCPACVVSPKCGNGNDPLDKSAAIRMLDQLLANQQHPSQGR